MQCRDPNGRAYNRTAHLEGRREMMQQWADYLDGLKQGRAGIAIAKEGIKAKPCIGYKGCERYKRVYGNKGG